MDQEKSKAARQELILRLSDRPGGWDNIAVPVLRVIVWGTMWDQQLPCEYPCVVYAYHEAIPDLCFEYLQDEEPELCAEYNAIWDALNAEQQRREASI